MKTVKILILGMLVAGPAFADQVIAFGPGFGSNNEKNSVLGQMSSVQLNALASDALKPCEVAAQKVRTGIHTPGTPAQPGSSKSGIIAYN